MKLHAVFLAFLLSSPLFAQDSRDSAFLAARDAFRAGDRARLERSAGQLGNHELAPYAENYLLRMNMEQGDPAALRDFFARNEGAFVTEKLRADWIRWLGKRGYWLEIDGEYPNLVAPEPDVTCWFQQARLAGGDKGVLDAAQQQWLTMLEPAEACRPVLEALIRNNRVTADDVWARARRQFEANRTGPAKATLAALPVSQTPDAKAHHPPFAVGIAGMDAIACRNGPGLACWLARHEGVEGLLCGHVHRFVSSSFADRPARTEPTPAHQIALQDGPLAYTLEPGGYLLHEWSPGEHWLSHYVPAEMAPVHVYRAHPANGD